AHEADRHRVIEQLRQQVEALTEEPDERVLIEMVKAFAPVSESQREELSLGLRTGLSDAKQALLSALSNYENQETVQGASFQQWLTRTKTQYEEMTGKP